MVCTSSVTPLCCRRRRQSKKPSTAAIKGIPTPNPTPRPIAMLDPFPPSLSSLGGRLEEGLSDVVDVVDVEVVEVDAIDVDDVDVGS